MVKHSLWKLLKKYPYFLDKRKGSNLYKVTKVYNSLFKDLYNSLFHIYESFHLNKRLLTWKTQNKPYVYTIHFRCGYANIKLIKIYKNDILIHQEEFSEDVAKERTENEIIYSWDYECSYLKTNMLPIKVYRCVECDAIYFGDELPYDCVGDNCNSNTYITTNIYRCDNCGEIYFYNPEEDGYINIDCKNNCNSTFTQVYAYRCMGDVVDSDNEFDEEIDGLGHNLVNEDCGEIYIGDEPPSVCNVCGAKGIKEDDEIYYSDDTIMVVDNSTDFATMKEISMSPDVEINHIDDSVLLNINKKLTVQIKDSADNFIDDVGVKLFYNSNNYDYDVTDNLGRVEFDIDITKKYNKIELFKSGFVSKYGEQNPVYELNLDYINNNYIVTITLIKQDIYNELDNYQEEPDFNLRVNNLDDINDTHETLRIPLPVIPDDKFKFYVETWDEYWVTKGYPENNEYVGDEYDHDYSLDDIGALNNIPRKKYINVNDNVLYPLTEPPYNNNLDEDDYHYMKRMIEYNIRLWLSLNILNEDDENYKNNIELLSKVGITEKEYELYKKDTRLFRERYNPVTLELWKNYSVPSTLINREKYLLKLFDLRLHNSRYVPYKTDDDGNPLIDNFGKYIYKDEWDVVIELSECWVPEKWEHKDKFCDGGSLYKYYLFVDPDTLRPLPYENVYCKFNLRNSVGEYIVDDYYVVLQVYYEDKSEIKYVNHRKIVEGGCTLPYTLLSNSKPTTIVFNAYYDYEDYLGSGVSPFSVVKITFNPRNSCNADFYVDSESVEVIEDGSKEYPFKSLQQALNKVNKHFDLICLKSDLTISEPLFVPNTCRILGVRERDVATDCELEQNVKNVPVITNTNNNNFFKLIGGKNCNLKLIDLRLKYKSINSYIGLGTWENKNRLIDDSEFVIIKGGLVKLNILLNKESYYPMDIVKIYITLTDKMGNYVGNQKVKLVFDNGEPVVLEDTDGDGIINYVLYVNKNERGVYNLRTSLISDIYFESTVLTKINCVKEPLLYISDGGMVNISFSTEVIEKQIGVYRDGVQIDTVTTNANGDVNYNFTPPDWGEYVLLFVDDDDVVGMVIIETKTTLTKLIGGTFIKNFEIDINGNVMYDKLVISNDMTLKDLDGVLIDLKVDGNIVKSKLFNVNKSRENLTELLASECVQLKDAIINLSYGSNTDVKFTRLGEFWRE